MIRSSDHADAAQPDRTRSSGRKILAAGSAACILAISVLTSSASSAKSPEPAHDHGTHVAQGAAPQGAQPYAIPAPGVGASSFATSPAYAPIQRPSGDNTGNFRVVCHYSHMNYDDAIVYPNQPGRAHMHTYFGNLTADANSTGASLLARGNSTCDGGTLNRSAYWVPSIIDGTGNAVIPDYNMIYYKSGYQGVSPAQVNPTLPVGLKMLAGDMKATAPQGIEPWERNINWSCSTEGWRGRQAYIPSCPAGAELLAEVQFPQCWDGKNLDSADHRSHVAYGTYGIGCPASHPVALPSISYNIHYKVPAGGTSNWRLASDMYTGGPGGYSMHADIITAWNEFASWVWLTQCVRQNADCNVGQVTDGLRLTPGVK